MPKMKTHKGIKKVVSNVSPNGKAKIMPSGHQHNTGTKPSKHSLDKRKSTSMSKSDLNRYKKMKIS